MILPKKSFLIILLVGFCIGYATLWLTSVNGELENRSTLPKGTEIASALSPDQTFKAIVWEPLLGGPLGATISQPYQVWIQVEKGRGKGEGLNVKTDLNLLLVGDKGEIRIKWSAPLELEICYDTLNTYEFINRFNDIVGRPSMDEMNVKTREGEVVLKRVKRLADC